MPQNTDKHVSGYGSNRENLKMWRFSPRGLESRKWEEIRLPASKSFSPQPRKVYLILAPCHPGTKKESAATSRCASTKSRSAARFRSRGASSTSAATPPTRIPESSSTATLPMPSPAATIGTPSRPRTTTRSTDNVLTFTSAIASPWPANNRVHAQFFPARKSQNGTRGPAVVVLAQWNARWEEQQNVCLWLNKLGLTAVKMSLPYHDRRAIPDHPRADHLVGPNIGLTMQAGRQAVLDVRRTLRWLEQQGYGPLGILGTSIGSAIGFITMCHEPAVRGGRVPARFDVFRRRGRHRPHDARPSGSRSPPPESRTTSFATSGRRSARFRTSRGCPKRRRNFCSSPRATTRRSGPNTPTRFSQSYALNACISREWIFRAGTTRWA